MLLRIVLVIGCCLGLALVSPGPRAGQEDDELTKVTRRVMADGKDAKEEDFEFLGKSQDIEAFVVLIIHINLVEDTTTMVWAFRALRDFSGSDYEARALDFILEAVDDKHEKLRREAAFTLVAFRSSAQAEMHKIVDTHKDPVCRAWALQGILPELKQEATPEGLGLVLKHTILTKTAYRSGLHEFLGAFHGPKNQKALEKLLRKKEISPFNKAVAVEAFGTRHADGIDGLLRVALRERSPIVVHAALRCVMERDLAEFERDLKKLCNSKDDSVRRTALIALGRLRIDDEDWLAQLERDAANKDSIRRQGAAVGLGELPIAAAAELLAVLLGDQDRSVVAEALAAIEYQRRKEPIPALIARLETATGQMRFDVTYTLRQLTGMELGLAPTPWQEWWAKEGEAFEVPPLSEIAAANLERHQQQKRHESVASFYGLPVVSDRVGFVLDTSGSMSRRMIQEKKKSPTRIEVAARELIGVLDKLADGALFHLICFGSEVDRWEKEPVLLNRRKREQITNFIETREPTGTTAIYEALELAMGDPRIDTLYVLSDGRPGGGATDDRESILTEVKRWNSTRHMVIHGVSVDGENALLQSLAEATGGTFLVAK